LEDDGEWGIKIFGGLIILLLSHNQQVLGILTSGKGYIE